MPIEAKDRIRSWFWNWKGPRGPTIIPVMINAKIEGCFRNLKTIERIAAIKITRVISKKIFSTYLY